MGEDQKAYFPKWLKGVLAKRVWQLIHNYECFQVRNQILDINLKEENKIDCVIMSLCH